MQPLHWFRIQSVVCLSYVPVKISHQLKGGIKVFICSCFYARQEAISGEHVIHEDWTPAYGEQHHHSDQHFHHLQQKRISRESVTYSTRNWFSETIESLRENITFRAE